ncbi:MAG: hypothetical protein JW940_06635 [Polyangiaceae bacterium]|nr:hypothetical protein [Polyangiaceae bacterium]
MNSERNRQTFGSHDAGWRIGPLLVALCLAPFCACSTKGQNAVSRRMIHPVALEVFGRMVDSETRDPLAGIELGVEAAPAGTASFEPVEGSGAVTDEQGEFRFTVDLDIETSTYLLSVEDPNGAYAPSRETELYAFNDDQIDLGDLALVPIVGELRGTVTGQVYAAVGGESGVFPLLGAQVRLLDPGDESTLTDWTECDTSGVFAMDDAPLTEALLEIRRPAEASDGSSYRLMKTVVRRLDLERRVTRSEPGASATLDIGRFYLPASHRMSQSGKLTDDLLTVVLSWSPDESVECDASAGDKVRNLDAALFMPGADCDINHLGGSELRLAAGAALDPAGLGRGTCFWPPFLGGADVPTIGQDLPTTTGMEQRVAVSAARPFQLLVDDSRLAQTSASNSSGEIDPGACPELGSLAARECGSPLAPLPEDDECASAVLAHASPDGREPEILTLFRNRFTRRWPRQLGYYYELEVTEDGEWSRRYPMAVAPFVVIDKKATLHRAQPVVEVYERSAFVARYVFHRLDSSTRSDHWIPFVVEIGSKRPTPESSEDIYFRVVPYDRATVDIVSTPYFYQDISLQHAVLDSGTGFASLSGGDAMLYTAEAGLSLVGQAQLEGQQRIALFFSDGDNGWSAISLERQGGSAHLARKDRTVLVSVEDSLFVGSQEVRSSETPEQPFCGGRILDIASDPEAPGDSFLVATDVGLRRYLGPRQLGETLAPASCTAFEEGAENPPPSRPVEHLIWLPGARYYLGSQASSLYPLRFDYRPEPRVVWPNPKSVATVPDQAQVLSLMRQGDDQVDDLFVGTSRGLYVYRGGPLNSEAYRVETCEAHLEENPDRPLPSDTAVHALAAQGRRLLVGTESGLAVTSSEEADSGRVLCLTWLPRDEGSDAASGLPQDPVPAFPAQMAISSLASAGERLYVLTRDRGLFFVDWSGK